MANSPKKLLSHPKYAKGKSVSKPKARAYLREYTSNGFNRTAAHNKINPKATYRSNNINAKRFHKNIPSEIFNESEFKIDHITIEYIISKIEKVLMDNKPNERLRALELLGDFKRIWADKGVNINTNIVNKADVDALKDTFSRIKTQC